MSIPRRARSAATRFGRAKGKSLKNLLCPNSPGYLVAGLAKAPPIAVGNECQSESSGHILEEYHLIAFASAMDFVN